MSDLKTYIYISRTKVDMWYEQIASARDRLGAEYGFDFKFLKWTEKREAKEPSLITKVQRIEDALTRSNRVGQFPSILQFVSGTVPMRWGTVRGMACFVAETPKLGMMLVGSGEHLVGALPQSDVLLRATSFDVSRILKELSAEYPGDILKTVSPSSDTTGSRQLDPIALTIRAFDAPTQNLQFVAKTLLSGEVGDRYIVCASTLYVALAE